MAVSPSWRKAEGPYIAAFRRSIISSTVGRRVLVGALAGTQIRTNAPSSLPHPYRTAGIGSYCTYRTHRRILERRQSVGDLRLTLSKDPGRVVYRDQAQDACHRLRKQVPFTPFTTRLRVRKAIALDKTSRRIACNRPCRSGREPRVEWKRKCNERLRIRRAN